MSDYTTQLRFICESYAGKKVPTPQAEIDAIISASREDIFNFDYPIFDPAYKETLETKIISHYYTEEIGSETVGLWKHQLKNKMREIMPFYNQLYLSEKIKFDPLVNTMLDDSRQTIGETNATGSQNGEKVSVLNYTDDVKDNRFTNGQNESESDNSGSYSKENSGSENDNRKTGETQEYTEHAGHTKTGTETLARTGTDTNTHTGTDTLAYKGKAEKKDVLEKEGAELTVDLPAHNLSVLHKHSDTPLGGIDGTVSGSQITGGGGGAVANYSNYLSDVSEDVTNFDQNPALGQGSQRKRNRAWTRFGKYFNPDLETGERVIDEPRKDTHTITEDYSKYEGSAPRQDQQTKNLTDTETLALQDQTSFNTSNADDTTGDKAISGYERGDKTLSGNESGEDNSHNVSRETSAENTHGDRLNTGERNGTDTTSNTTENKTEENKDYFGRLYGKTGSVSFSQLLQEYRQTFLNIDMQVIDALQPLFMGIW